MPFEIPFVGWIAIVIGGLILSIVLVAKLRAEGRTHGLNFFMSLQFWMMFTATTVTYYSVFPAMFAEESEVTQVFSENALFGLYFFIVTILVSWIMNIKKSTFEFGTIFTLGQAFVSSLSAFILFLVVARFFMRDR